MTSRRALIVSLLASLGGCSGGKDSTSTTWTEPEDITCVYVAYETDDGCNVVDAPEACVSTWREGCTYQPPSTCVSLGNVERTPHGDTDCRDLGYTISCGEEWVTQDYVDSWPFGYEQACPEATGGTTSPPDDGCGRCGTFGSFGRCCGGAYCAGECIGDACC